MVTLRRWMRRIGRALVNWGQEPLTFVPGMWEPLTPRQGEELRALFSRDVNSAWRTKVEDAVRDSYQDVGLPLHFYAPDFDVARSGKLHDLLHRVGAKLGRSHRLQTVDDVIQHFLSHG